MGSSGGRLLRVRIGELDLDERTRELRSATSRVAVQPKVFDVLVYLVRARDRVVPRDELERALWPEVTVGPDSVTRALREVRRLVGTAREMARTYPGRGVRFVGPVIELESTDDPQAPAVDPIERDMFGMDGPLAAIEAVLACAISGRGGLRIVIGPPGSGKSTLLAAAERRARVAGFEVIGRSAIAGLDQLAGETGTRRHPVLVVCDDVMRAHDAHDLDAKRLTSIVTTAPVVVLAACCSSSRREQRIAALIAAAIRTDPDAIIALGRLDRRALAGVAEHVLRRAVSPAALSKLEAVTGGNPRFARHILHMALKGDRALETLDRVPVSFADCLHELVLEHVGVVGAETRALLDAVSVLDLPFALDVAAEIAAIEPGNAADCIAEASSVGLVVESAAGWQFAQELVRSVIGRALPPSIRATFHARAAAALDRSLGTPPSQLDRIANHYAAGASVAHAARALEVVRQAADVASDSWAFDIAARWATMALEIETRLVPSSPARRRQLRIELATALARDGQLERAADVLAAVSDGGSAPTDGDVVRAALLAIAPDLPRIVERFYELFFERHPHVRPMFTRAAPLQRRMFGETIATFVDRISDPAWMRDHLHELGRRHAEYGVTENMYGWAREAFLDAIASVSAPRRMPPAVRELWKQTFDSISALMLAAKDDAQARATAPSSPETRRRTMAPE